jgi:hypothetical protein
MNAARCALPLSAVLVAAGFLLTALPACAGAGESPAEEPREEAAAAAEPEPLVGTVTRAEMEAHRPDWVAAQVEARPDAAAGAALAAVEPGAAVTVYLGTWCSDSKRELARLWRAWDDAGVFAEDELPFAVEYVALDRDKQEPSGRAVAANVEYVPTFVVSRRGEEVGRVVEIAVEGIERDLLALLSGAASGVISARDELAGTAATTETAAPADTAGSADTAGAAQTSDHPAGGGS